MTFDTYRLIFLIGAILAGLMLVTSVVLFFVLKIPRVIGDLSGATARKAIAGIRSQNEQSDGKPSDAKRARSDRDKSPSGKKKAASRSQTQKLAGVTPETTVLPLPAEETTVLAEETTLLQQNETTVLAPQVGETAQLVRPEPVPVSSPQIPTGVFVIEYELTYIHTDEFIA